MVDLQVVVLHLVLHVGVGLAGLEAVVGTLLNLKDLDQYDTVEKQIVPKLQEEHVTIIYSVFAEYFSNILP